MSKNGRDDQPAGGAGPPQFNGEPTNGDIELSVDDVVELLAEIQRLQAEASENYDNYQRAVADMANYRRRKELDTQRQIERAREQLLLRLLPVVDDFRRALGSVPADAANADWVEGFRLIERKLWNVLQSEGVRPMEAVGERFDPNLHEAVLAAEGASAPDTVVAEFEPGYYIGEQVLRPARVKVGQASDVPVAGQ
jgi:molecular chaperone GrpE